MCVCVCVCVCNKHNYLPITVRKRMGKIEKNY